MSRLNSISGRQLAVKEDEDDSVFLKISNWLANFDFSKIRTGWVKQVIVSIFQTKVIIYLTITFEIFMKSVLPILIIMEIL